ncbi:MULTISPECIES: Tn3 family transposase [unclassified Streptomyces]|uniref:Tn3 family transposase n=1 Tax=unclassified Streptomyces TaxID=2593676 RepID=UPI003669BEA2
MIQTNDRSTTQRRDEQEMFALCLRILQSTLLYVNTLMLQDVLDEPEWADLHPWTWHNLALAG